jgi:hypothetical protein
MLDWISPVPIVIVFVITYPVVAWILWRRLPLHGIFKYVYCSTVGPVYVFLMLASIAGTEFFAPEVIEWFRTPYEHSFVERRLESVAAFLVAGFLPVLLCWVWYRFFVELQKKGAGDDENAV